jgi:hypothetical protein
MIRGNFRLLTLPTAGAGFYWLLDQAAQAWIQVTVDDRSCAMPSRTEKQAPSRSCREQRHQDAQAAIREIQTVSRQTTRLILREGGRSELPPSTIRRW